MDGLNLARILHTVLSVVFFLAIAYYVFSRKTQRPYRDYAQSVIDDPDAPDNNEQTALQDKRPQP